MGFISWIILGLVAGFIASMITGRREGIFANMIIGIIGAFIGGFILNLFGADGVTGFNLWSILTAVLGSVVLLAIVKAFRGNRHTA